jgi:hypothetical protein
MQASKGGGGAVGAHPVGARSMPGICFQVPLPGPNLASPGFGEELITRAYTRALGEIYEVFDLS